MPSTEPTSEESNPMISGKKAKEFIEDMRHCGEPTSEDLIASVRHQLGADHHPSDTVIMRKSTVRMLAQRLEEAREAIRSIVEDCTDEERCKEHFTRLERELSK